MDEPVTWGQRWEQTPDDLRAAMVTADKRTRTKGRRLHGQLVKDCLALLSLHGFPAWQRNTGAVKVGERFIKYGFPGAADIECILPGGRHLEVECKVGRDKLSDSQEAFRALVELAGGLYFEARDTVAGLDALLRGMKK